MATVIEGWACARTGHGGPAGRRRVLVIDDEPAVQEMLEEFLDLGGYEVAVMDSAFGVASVARRLGPEVILLDLRLPYRSGASLLADLKADPRTADIPVIVVSGMTDVLSGKRRALAFGVIAKPFEPAMLLETVRLACAA